MRRGLLVVAPMPAEMPSGLAKHGISCQIVGPRARLLPQGGLEGDGAVLIVGACGALVAGRSVGALMLADEVIDTQGLLRPAAPLTDALARASREAGIDFERARLAQAHGLVDRSGDRKSLALATGAAFVDLESALIARRCEADGRPWAVLRTVSDTPESPLDWLGELLGREPDSQPPLLTVLSRLALRPWMLPRLISLGSRIARAKREVREIVSRLPD